MSVVQGFRGNSQEILIGDFFFMFARPSEIFDFIFITQYQKHVDQSNV